MKKTTIKEPAKVRFLQEQIRPGDNFIDIGAHKGYFTFLAAKLVGPTGNVFAFEPCRETFNWLSHEIAKSRYPNVHIYDYAISNVNNYGHLYLGESSVLHSLKPNLPGRTEETEIVDVIPLDEFFWPVDIDGCKIDVEGNEAEVLLGATQKLKTMRYLAMDVHPRLGVNVDTVKDILRSSGFTIITRPHQRNELFGVRE